MPKPTKKEKGISRIDSGTTRGWYVRRYRNGEVYSKLFSDRRLGGSQKALKAARDYLNQLSAELKALPQEPRKRRIVRANPRNTTGELGVTRVSKLAANGKKYDCFSVSWRPEPGFQRTTSFSIKKYGEKNALKLAIDHRRKMMKEIHGPDFYA